MYEIYKTAFEYFGASGLMEFTDQGGSPLPMFPKSKKSTQLWILIFVLQIKWKFSLNALLIIKDMKLKVRTLLRESSIKLFSS